MDAPETRYAKSGSYRIAYQVFGEGTFDLVIIPAFVSHVEMWWEQRFEATIAFLAPCQESPSC
ncbi:MAG TPA: hypothetical protein VGR77_00270 [Candidatus Dormibacteraeota bacterium]|nr:hypothetical protein [Candidatus Dormibacteraeota bacterium]